jgi:SAM-dependent methyltransferase
MGTTNDLYVGGRYLQQHQTWHVEDSPWKARQIIRILQKNNVAPKSVAEVGCGAGEILAQLSNAMPDASFVGYELSPQAFALCRTRESAKVTFRLQDIHADPETFDCLLCIDVFEHVEDYMGFTRALRGKARYVVFHIPLEVTVLSVLRGTLLSQRKGSGHLHYFTLDTALATLRDCGYTVIDSAYTTPFLDFPATTLKRKIAKPFVRAMFAVAPHLTVRALGFCSLLVLAHTS